MSKVGLLAILWIFLIDPWPTEVQLSLLGFDFVFASVYAINFSMSAGSASNA